MFRAEGLCDPTVFFGKGTGSRNRLFMPALAPIVNPSILFPAKISDGSPPATNGNRGGGRQGMALAWDAIPAPHQGLVLRLASRLSAPGRKGGAQDRRPLEPKKAALVVRISEGGTPPAMRGLVRKGDTKPG